MSVTSEYEHVTGLADLATVTISGGRLDAPDHAKVRVLFVNLGRALLNIVV
jgi:hypothetical protein